MTVYYIIKSRQKCSFMRKKEIGKKAKSYCNFQINKENPEFHKISGAINDYIEI